MTNGPPDYIHREDDAVLNDHRKDQFLAVDCKRFGRTYFLVNIEYNVPRHLLFRLASCERVRSNNCLALRMGMGRSRKFWLRVKPV